MRGTLWAAYSGVPEFVDYAIEVSNAVSRAVTMAGMKGEAVKLTAEAMLRNLTIAERLG